MIANNLIVDFVATLYKLDLVNFFTVTRQVTPIYTLGNFCVQEYDLDTRLILEVECE